MLYIGIDPGYNDCGVAVFNKRKGQFVLMKTGHWLKMLAVIRGYSILYVSAVVIEDPSQNAPIFGAKEFLKKHGLNVLLDRAQKVGGNKRLGLMLCELLEGEGYTVIRVRPKKRKEKLGGKGKLTREEFKRLSGYTGLTSEHSRDAGMLVLGR